MIAMLDPKMFTTFVTGPPLGSAKLDTSKNLVVTGGWGWFGSAEARSVA